MVRTSTHWCRVKWEFVAASCRSLAACALSLIRGFSSAATSYSAAPSAAHSTVISHMEKCQMQECMVLDTLWHGARRS